MYKFLIIPLLICAPKLTWAIDYNFTVGLGTQYGGLGSQYVINHEDSKYYVALGLPGASVGMKTLISENQYHSMGTNYGKIFGLYNYDTEFVAMTYNYHFNGFKRRGWELGAGLGYMKETRYKYLFSNKKREEKTGSRIVFNLGYSF